MSPATALHLTGPSNVLTRCLGELVIRRLAGGCPLAGARVDPARFGIAVGDPVCRARIESILTAFFRGFECGLGAPRRLDDAARGVEPLLAPFFHEGAAMGLLPNGLLGCRGAAFTLAELERRFADHDPFVFLRYVGVGFWLGFRYPTRPAALGAVAGLLRSGARYRHLLHDGYGFHHGFFRRRGEPHVAPLRALEGFERASAFSGLGRSLWFFRMDRWQDGIDEARALGSDGPHAVGGMGLAAAFTFVDDLSRAYAIADALEPAWRRHFVKGIRIALYVRATADREHLEACLAALACPLRARAAGDLEAAFAAGEATRAEPDFIERFHHACLET